MFTAILSLALGCAAYFIVKMLERRNIRVSMKWMSPNFANSVVYALVLGYAFTFSTLSVLRYLSFHLEGYDLAIFDQVVWNSLRGRLFENSILPDAPLLIGQRFSPILLAFVPLYAIWSSPIVLLIAQTLGIALSALPLYWFARPRLGYSLSLSIVLVYFLFPALEYVNLYEFHEVGLSILIFSFAMFFLLRRMFKPLIICLFVALLLKEEMALVTATIGLYILVVQRQRAIGIGVIIASAFSFFVVMEYVLPFFSVSGHGGYYYFGHGIFGTGRYDYLGHSLNEVVVSLLTRPDLIWAHLAIPAKADFVTALFAPLAFLPFLGAEIGILVLPTLALSLLSDFAPQFSIQDRYSAAALPFLFFATVKALERLMLWRASPLRVEPARRLALGILLLIAGVGGYVALAPGPLARSFDPQLYLLNAHTQLGHDLLRALPEDAVVAAQSGFEPYLSHRRFVSGFPIANGYPPVASPCDAEYLFADTQRAGYAHFKTAWENWLQLPYFYIANASDGYLVVKRREPDQNVGIHFENAWTLLDYAIAPVDIVFGDQTLCAIVKWRADEPMHRLIRFQARLQDARGHNFIETSDDLMTRVAAENQWRVGESFNAAFTFRLQHTIPTGVYRLVASLYDPALDRYLTAYKSSEPSQSIEAVFGNVRIEKDKSNTTAGELFIPQPFFVDMHEMRLLGYAGLTDRAVAGETMELGIYWRAREKPQGDYMGTLQLRDARGNVVVEQSNRPADGTYPTTMWDAGEVLLDWHDLVIPEDLLGDYALVVLLRDVTRQTVLGETTVTGIKIVRP